MPPTRMSRSDSAGCPPRTKACAASTVRRMPRAAASARARAAAAASTASCERPHSRSAMTASGSRYGIPYTATSPPESRISTGRSRSASEVRRCTPDASLSAEPKPSRTAESWLPLVSTTGMPSRANRVSAVSSSRTASSGGTARS